MNPRPDVFLHACDCRTALGNAQDSWQSLIDGQIALAPTPPLSGSDDRVPLALTGPLAEVSPPRWLAASLELLAESPKRPWGSARYPIVVTSSNFGIDQMLAFHQDPEAVECSTRATAVSAVEAIAESLGWGANRIILSNACVSAQLGLIHATRLLENDLADEALVFSFDYLSHFVVGGFHSLKILNADFPQPYAARKTGSIGLGDGAGFAVLSRQPTPYRLAAATTHSEFHHMTGNHPTGSGFDAVIAPLAKAATGHRIWVKGHGTGTLEAGCLEAEAVARALPGAPLVSWKGSLGHTLGSCGLVELAIARIAIEKNQAPGTIGSQAPFCADNVTAKPFALNDFTGVILLSSAFGGAHAGHLLLRE
ncbi:hypothetical protein [Cerasicoccus arenae]|uniref:Beta-ketoacyl synthase C-terminal domain-containing protein n=1 Tax=Cerasicoccus arenae TaxID=424488 RepID=A0A8J3GCN4_9BACT|nr:hypothetical protein [Cerasicoccus arenae]MBK1858317.1 hypothetical protein [Cerasicoccus arenae]GHB90734.1 hypothetical protein GCM10007047_01930 [Cerasicoccus arenae]